MTTAIEHTVHVPTERGGWWHRYVCPVHGVELEHVDLLGGQFPAGGAPCRHGCRVDTPQVRGAWHVLAHQAVARRLSELAPAGAGRILQEIAHTYGALGTVHEDAEEWMLRGRMFAQALTEAIWAVPVAQAAWKLGREPALRQALATSMDTARDELIRQDRFRSNYTAWFIAAALTCTRDAARLPELYAHIRASVMPDGWQWEASTYYHTFVLRAYLLALRAVDEVHLPADIQATLTGMAQVIETLRIPGGLPALHDGPYERPAYADELAELAELIEQAGLVTTAPKPVEVFADAGYAVVRHSGLTAVLAFGPHGGSHGHLDKLALYLYGPDSPWQPDPGQVPYGDRQWRDYYASTAAHPTFCVDGQPQQPCTGRLVAYDDRSVTVACDEAYVGVRARRRIALTPQGLADELSVSADRPRTIAAHLRPGVALRVLAGADGALTSRWDGATTLFGDHNTDRPARMMTRPGPGAADDPQRVRVHADWIAEDTSEITFRSDFRLGE